MSADNETEVASRVSAVVRELNQALLEAANIGLKAHVSVMSHEAFGKKAVQSIVNVELLRPISTT